MTDSTEEGPRLPSEQTLRRRGEQLGRLTVRSIERERGRPIVVMVDYGNGPEPVGGLLVDATAEHLVIAPKGRWAERAVIEWWRVRRMMQRYQLPPGWPTLEEAEALPPSADA